MSDDSDKSGNSGKPHKGEDYPVGYGKPPKATQFAKGRSGNPRGRPRKPKKPEFKLSDAPYETFLGKEAYRKIRVREHGEEKELYTEQALIRALIMSGLKGNRLSLKYILEHLQAKEEESLKRRIWYYNRLEKLKRDGEKLIAERKRKDLPPPEKLLPHPDDIVLKPSSREAFVQGPETPEELQHYEFRIATRDHFLLKAADAMKAGKGPQIEHEGQKYCFYLFWSHMFNRMLPCSLRRGEKQETYLVMQHISLTKRERARLIAEGEKHLEALAEKPSPFASESETPFERKLDEIIEKARQRQKPGPDSARA